MYFKIDDLRPGFFEVEAQQPLIVRPVLGQQDAGALEGVRADRFKIFFMNTIF